VQDLVSTADPDWQAFQTKDPDWFLKVAGDAIRIYCGWHLFPNVQATKVSPIGAKGIIMLRSRYVTDVSNVTVFPKSNDPCVLDPERDYTWYADGWIQRNGWPLWGDTYSGYYYGNDPYYLPVFQAGEAQVTFNHGYDVLPNPVKEVAYELALSTIQMRAGNIKEIATPGFRLAPGQCFGLSLNDEQKNRLANFRIGGVL
jgi:hypothetical protein